MRLICPNCGAQYEVGAGVIPDGGRDVQCSNCGHTWFENPEAPTATAEEDAFFDIVPAAPAEERVDVAAPPAEPVDTPAPPETPAPATMDDAPATPPAPPTPEPRPIRTQLDPSIADILREEAAREEEARRAEARGGLEQQGDLGLTEPVTPPSSPTRKPDPVQEGRERVDRLQGRTAPVASTTPVGSRKELFPDIEEINSTLRSSADRDRLMPLPADDPAQSRRSGWRGFLTVITLFVLLGLVYAYADRIAAAVPALADPLAGYVASVDAGRLWLDAQVQTLLGESTDG